MLDVQGRNRKSIEWVRRRTRLKYFVLEARERKWRYVRKVFVRGAEGRWDGTLIRWTLLTYARTVHMG